MINKSFASPDLKEGIAPVSVFFFDCRKIKNQVLILINASRHLLCTTVFFYVKILFDIYIFAKIRCFVSVSQIAVSVWFGELRPFAGAREVWKLAYHSLWDLSNLHATALPAAFFLPPLPLPHGSAPRQTPAPPSPPRRFFPREHRLFSRDRSPAGGGGGGAVARIWLATENAACVDAASSERFLRNLCDPSSCVSQSGRRTGLGCPLPVPPTLRPALDWWRRRGTPRTLCGALVPPWLCGLRGRWTVFHLYFKNRAKHAVFLGSFPGSGSHNWGSEASPTRSAYLKWQ